ncbi:hypothetical protein FRC08_005710 [Ceratobasidium sp. 394]|nr:hypothetical protein FRC08_005710 [Ceratobasidium sp. 394]
MAAGDFLFLQTSGLETHSRPTSRAQYQHVRSLCACHKYNFWHAVMSQWVSFFDDVIQPFFDSQCRSGDRNLPVSPMSFYHDIRTSDGYDILLGMDTPAPIPKNAPEVPIQEN